MIARLLPLALCVGLAGCGDQINAVARKAGEKIVDGQTANYVRNMQATIKDVPECAAFKERMAAHGREGTMAQGKFTGAMVKTYEEAKAAGCRK